MAQFCPECGGLLKIDTITKNFICTSCGLFTSREKLDEIRQKSTDFGNTKSRTRDDYLDWWQSSKNKKRET